MARFADRVKETSTTTGTGALTLLGASTGFQSFNAAVGIGVRVPYAIVDNASATGEWEVGEGYLTTSSNFVRDLVTASSNSGALVNLSAGTKSVILTIPAARLGSSLVFADDPYGLGMN